MHQWMVSLAMECMARRTVRRKCVTQSDGDSDICDIRLFPLFLVFPMFPMARRIVGQSVWLEVMAVGLEIGPVTAVIVICARWIRWYSVCIHGRSGDGRCRSCRTSQVTMIQGSRSPLRGAGDVLEIPDFMCDIDPGPGKPSLESGGMLELPDFASDSNQGPGRTSPESRDIYIYWQSRISSVTLMIWGPGRPPRSPEIFWQCRISSVTLI